MRNAQAAAYAIGANISKVCTVQLIFINRPETKAAVDNT
jgi:hypothetical protein